MTLGPVRQTRTCCAGPTTRRYITAMESARKRQVIILPTVDHELKRHLPTRMGEHLDSLATRDGKTEDPRLREAKARGGDAAGLWCGRGSVLVQVRCRCERGCFLARGER